MNCWHCNTEVIWGGDHDMEEEALVDPNAEHSTELGEGPQEPTKGSIFPGMNPYALFYEYY